MLHFTQYLWIYDYTLFQYMAYLVIMTYVLIATLSVGYVVFMDNTFMTLLAIETMKGWLDIWLNYIVDKIIDIIKHIWFYVGEPVWHIVVTILFYIFVLTMAMLAAIIFCYRWVVDYVESKK